MPRLGLQIIRDDIGPYYAEMVDRGAQEVTDRMKRGASEIQAAAQRDAPWRDITGQARDGLWCEVYEDYDEIVLELGHSVDYGEWLETIQNGQYAIILPTLEKMGGLVFRDAGEAFMNGGGLY